MRLFFLLGILLAAGCDVSPTCEPEVLRERLGSAGAGQIVEVGDCPVDGRFVVPAGVSLEGTGPASAVAADSEGPTLVLGGGASVRGLTVIARGHAAVRVRDVGSATLEDLVLRAPTGVGVAAEDVASLRIARVTIEGGLASSEEAAGVPAEPSATEWPTHGLALVRVADAQLADVSVRGFARFGALFVGGAARWERGGVGASLGTGVMVSGGTAELVDLVVSDLWTPLEGLVPSYGVVAASGATLRTTRLEVRECEFGVLQDSASAEHGDLSIHDNRDVGLWAQDAVGLSVTGLASALVRNRVAGIVLIESSAIVLADASIDETALGMAARGFGSVEAGDGVHIMGGQDIELRGLGLARNGRVQILVELSTTRAPEIVLDGVSVDGTGTELGLVVQGGATPEGWDASVTRLGSTGANDAAWVGTLGTLTEPATDRIPTGPPGGSIDGIVMPID